LSETKDTGSSSATTQNAPLGPTLKAEQEGSPMDDAAPHPHPLEEAPHSSHKKQKKKKGRMKSHAVGTPTQDEQSSALSMHAELYALGAKYQIAPLQWLALNKFKQEVEAHWHTEQFIEAIDVAFRTTSATDLQLRLTIKTLTIQHYARLVDNVDFAETVNSIDGLAFGLFEELCSHTETLRKCCAAASRFDRYCTHQSFFK
jgi:hypothetical protein